jgi:hypothetical protein
MIPCDFKSNCNRASLSIHHPSLDVAYPESAIMRQALTYERISRRRLYSSKARGSPHPGPAVIRAGNHLAIACLFFGAAFAAFLSGSLEQRIGNLVSLGLIPAFYAGGHVLGQLLVFGIELCDMIMARCSRYALHLATDLLRRARHACLELVDRGRAHQARPAELTPAEQQNSHSARPIR